MKRFDSFNWTMTPHYPYTPFRVQNMETDVKNQSILPPIPCQVPGSIYEALEKAGIIENPYFEMNSLKCQWVSNHWWVFDGKVELHPKGNGERLELVGVRIVQKKAKEFFYRHYSGFNTLVIRL